MTPLHKERPILFSGPMVRAILEGRKTQTRRIFKDKVSADCVAIQYYAASDQWRQMFVADKKDNLYPKQWWHKCPYGKREDRLWVKETHGINPDDGGIVFRATDPDWEDCEGWKWRPSMFMRRMDSRITLHVADVRVERLNDITHADAIREGIIHDPNLDGFCYDNEGRGFHGSSAVRAYENLWRSINGEGSWEANPWVWVVEFKRP